METRQTTLIYRKKSGSLESQSFLGYAYTMTLANRNRFFRTGIILSAISLVIIIFSAFIILPAYNIAVATSIQRSESLLQHILVNILKTYTYAPFISMVCAVVYSLIGISLIYYFFEKTQSPEIIFIGFFIISFAFECIRIIIPLKFILNLPNIYLINCSRVLFFGRYFGLFSLFSASIYSAGLETQKQQNIVFVSAIASFSFALGVPMDGFSWDTSMVLLNDFNTTFIMIQAGIMIITTVSFFVAAHTRGSKEYITIGTGALLTFIGRNVLFTSDTWLGPIPGLVILCLGTWLICTRFHR